MARGGAGDLYASALLPLYPLSCAKYNKILNVVDYHHKMATGRTATYQIVEPYALIVMRI